MLKSLLSSFDYTVFAVLAGCLLLLVIVVWRGNPAGADSAAQGGASSPAAEDIAAEDATSDGATASPPPSDEFYSLIVNDAGVAQLEVARLNTPGEAADAPQVITNAEYGVWDYTVSPRDGVAVYSQLGAQGSADLWQAAPGQTPSLLLDCGDAACNTPTFSHDGALLAYARHNASATGATIMSPPRIWLLDLASGETAPLLSDSQRLGYEPSFSPDGAWLAFVSPDNLATTLVHLEDGAERIYPNGTGEIGAWSPQSDSFAYSVVLTTTDVFPMHLMLTSMASESTVDISAASLPTGSAEVSDDAVAFSPDGEWLAFRRKFLGGEQETPGKQVWIMRTDGSEARALTSEEAFDNAAPQWSADGDTLIFHRFNLRNAPIVLRIMAVDVNNGILWEVISPGQDPQWRN